METAAQIFGLDPFDEPVVGGSRQNVLEREDADIQLPQAHSVLAEVSGDLVLESGTLLAGGVVRDLRPEDETPVLQPEVQSPRSLVRPHLVPRLGDSRFRRSAGFRRLLPSLSFGTRAEVDRTERAEKVSHVRTKQSGSREMYDVVSLLFVASERHL